MGLCWAFGMFAVGLVASTFAGGLDPQLDFGLPNSFKPCSTQGVKTAAGKPLTYSLCYYAKCDVIHDDQETWPWSGKSGTANCGCIPWYGTNWVDTLAILNETISDETDAECGLIGGGSACLQTNSAPVCDYMNDPVSFFTELTYGPADSISDFSLAFSNLTKDVSPYQLGATNCPSGRYAGCMTAPCYFESVTIDGETFPVTCKCPVVEGVYTIGQDNATCDLGPDMVWSAAVTPVTIEAETDACLPDSPGSFQCPLFEPPVFCGNPPYVDVQDAQLCKEACQAAANCQGDEGVMETFLCDSTVCSSTSSSGALQCATALAQGNCNMTAIIEVEAQAKCSCCFESVCGCVPNYQTLRALGLRKMELGGEPDFHDPLSCPIIGAWSL